MVGFEITILTLNTWGIPLISRDRVLRMEAIAEKLSSGEYDVVSLQEVWSQKDYDTLKEHTSRVLPFSHYFHSGVMGAGLVVLSKYRIIGTLFHAWSVNGYFHRVQHADWFGGKGVGLCRLLMNDEIIHIYTAHLHAEYNNEHDDYKTHRVLQAFDTAQFIEATKGESILQILAGDLNTQPEDISYKLLLNVSKMEDCCNNDSFATNECVHNSYTSKNTKAKAKKKAGIRIDHIFLSSSKSIQASVLEYSLPFPNRVPGQKFSYSDHEAVMAKIKILPQTVRIGPFHNDNKVKLSNLSPICTSTDLKCSTFSFEKQTVEQVNQHIQNNSLRRKKEVLIDAIALCDSSLIQLKMDRIFYFSVALILFLFVVALVEISTPIFFKTIDWIIKFIVFSIMLFCLFMGSIWNFIEKNGVLSGKKAMEILLEHTENNI